MARSSGVYRATRPCCRHWSIRTPHRASPCASDAAIASISSAFDPTKSHGTSMTTVQGFYLALGAGNGEEAAKFVVPEKRSSGPLSAIAVRNFYSNLVEPLTLIDVVPLVPTENRVR